MRSSILITTLFVALQCLISLPISTVAFPKKPWPKPLQLVAAHHHQKGFRRLEDSNDGWARSSSTPELLAALPNIPGLPSIPEIPSIPRIPSVPDIPTIPNIPDLPEIPIIPRVPNIPGLPGLPRRSPLHPFDLVGLLQSAEMENCFTNEESNTTEKCFLQISSSWAENDFALDKECCKIVMKMGKKCNAHVRMLFRSRFFVPLLQDSCHIKHTRN